MTWQYILRVLLISQVGASIGLMVTTVEVLRAKKETAKPAPPIVNYLFAAGVLSLLLLVAQRAYQRIGAGDLTASFYLGGIGTTVLIAALVLMLRYWTRNDWRRSKR